MQASCPIVFSIDRSWSLPINGETIDFVTYDPVAFSMKVIYRDGSLVLLGTIGINTTQQITSAPSREAAVQALVNTYPHIGQPTNQEPPVVEGFPFVGNSLFAYPGIWCQSPTSYLFQWLRDGSPIGGATGQCYVVQMADSGHQLAVAVTAVNAYGESVPVIALAPALVLATEGGVIITTEGGQPLEIEL